MAEKKSKSVKKVGTKKSAAKKPVVYKNIAAVVRAKQSDTKRLVRGFELVIDGKNITGYASGQKPSALVPTSVRTALFDLLKGLGLKVRYAF